MAPADSSTMPTVSYDDAKSKALVRTYNEAGRQDAFAELWGYLNPFLIGHLRGISDSHEDAEDIAQDAWIRFRKAIATYNRQERACAPFCSA
jgi:DNA-directed RNA polymerase specialized sigma24 family protein